MDIKKIGLDEVIQELTRYGDTETIGIINCMDSSQIEKLLERVGWVVDNIAQGVSKNEGFIEGTENLKDRKVRIFQETFRRLVDCAIKDNRPSVYHPHRIIK